MILPGGFESGVDTMLASLLAGVVTLAVVESQVEFSPHGFKRDDLYQAEWKMPVAVLTIYGVSTLASTWLLQALSETFGGGSLVWNKLGLVLVLAWVIGRTWMGASHIPGTQRGQVLVYTGVVVATHQYVLTELWAFIPALVVGLMIAVDNSGSMIRRFRHT